MTIPSKAQAFLRFGASGAVNTLGSWLLFLVLLTWVPYQVAYGVAYVIGIGTGYLLATKYVFKEVPTVKGLFAYPLVYVVQYALSAALLFVLVRWADITVELAPLAVAVLIFPVTFVLSRLIISRTSTSPEQRAPSVRSHQ